MKIDFNHFRWMAAVGLGLTAQSSLAATLTSGYATGSGVLAPNGETLFIDRAALSGGDATFANGVLPFSVEVPDVWESGMEVTLTGIAIPVHSESQPGTFTFTFYDLDGGDDPNAFDGTEAETVIGTATAVLESSTTSPHYAIFDTPVSFTARSKGVAVHIQNTARIRLKINTATSAPRAIRKSNADGSTYSSNPHLRMSLAGTTFDPRLKLWYGDKSTLWDTVALNWNWGTNSYADGDRVTFDDTTVASSPVSITLAADHSPGSVTFANEWVEYTLTGGAIIGEGGLRKGGASVLTLAQANNYSGDTVINGGQLRLGASDVIPDGPDKGNVTVAANATLDLAGRNEVVNNLTGGGIVDNSSFAPARLTFGSDDENGSTFAGVFQNNGGGPLTIVKQGGNTVTLTGFHFHSGATIVGGGRLVLNPAHAFSASSPLVVSNGAVLAFNLQTSMGYGAGSPSLSLEGAEIRAFYGNLFGTPSYTTALSVSGNLSINGENTISLTGTNLGIGLYPIISFTQIEGSGSFGPPALPVGVFGKVETNGNTIVVNVTNVLQEVIWYGNNGSGWTTPNNWNFGNASYNDFGTFGDGVVFDGTLDPATLNTNVTLAVDVRPVGMTVNASYDYSFSGPGKITGPTELVKQGSGAVTFNTANDFEGGSSIEGGMVRLGNDAGLGTGKVTIAGAGLSSDSATARTLANDLDLRGHVTFGDAQRSGLLTLSGTITFGGSGRGITVPSDVMVSGSSSNGGFTIKDGPGNLILTGSSVQSSTWGLGEGAIIIDGGAVTTGVIRVSSQIAQQTTRLVVTNGGSLTTTGNMRVGSAPEFAGSTTSTNIVDLDGFLSTGSIQIGDRSKLAQINLYSGSVLAFQRLDYRANQAEVNVDGGTMVAKTDATSFIESPITVAIQAGGLTIDSAGFGITIPAVLSGSGGVTKIGAGTLNLNGANDYLGATLVSEGTLGGNGVIAGPVQVAATGTLSPGTSVGTLTINNNLTLAGETIIEVDKTLSPSSDLIAVSGALTYGGTLTPVNIGVEPLVIGDTFQVFTFGSQSGDLTIEGTPGEGLAWSFDKATGVLSVIAGSPVDPDITFTVSGNTLDLSWPETGWILQVQTSALDVGLTSDWVDVPESASLTSTNIVVDPQAPVMFFRLRKP